MRLVTVFYSNGLINFLSREIKRILIPTVFVLTMSLSSDVLTALQRFQRRCESWLGTDDYATVKLVAGLTLVALLLRVVFLGSRVAHFDEGRVAYWAWHFSETGSFAYRYIIHGPLIQHVDRWLFPLIGATDFAMRLPVAVVGGLLPLSALLFRRHLDSLEVVALALFFSLNPLLLYYSRFLRSDILVAAFMFTAFGYLIRLCDTRNSRYIYAVSLFLAFGFASKENALVYVVTWLGATGLLLAKIFLLPAGFRDVVIFITDTPSINEIIDRLVAGWQQDTALVIDFVRSVRARHDSAWLVAGTYLLHTVLALGLFTFVSLFFYAPRGAGVPGIEYPPVPPSAGTVGFWEGITNPSLFSQLLNVTTDRVIDQWGEWLEPASGKSFDTYAEHLGVFINSLGYGAGTLSVLSGLGYIYDRLGYTTPRHLIPFCFYCGFVSIFGYPLGTDISAPWIAIHAAIPLAIPAAVAVVVIFRWGADAVSADDIYGATVTALIFILVVGFIVNGAVTMVYTNTTDESNELVQFAQPTTELKGTLRKMRRVATNNDTGPDVVVYYGQSGEDFHNDTALVKDSREDWDESWWNTRPTCLMWHNSLPLPWYFASGEMNVRCENDQVNLTSRAQVRTPPVIITQEPDPTVPRTQLKTAGYSGKQYLIRTDGSSNIITVWFRQNVTVGAQSVADRRIL